MSVRPHRFKVRDTESAEAMEAVVVEPLIQPTTT